MQCSIGRRAAFVGVGVCLAAAPAHAAREWTFQDIVEVDRIASTALTPDGVRAAFITRRMSLADNATRFALFEVRVDGQGAPRLLARAQFLDDVQWNAAQGIWTVRADLGRGVQLYGLRNGELSPLLERPAVPVGGAESSLPSPSEAERPTGVIRYGWNAAGDGLWYVQARAASSARLGQWWTQGLRYVPGQTPTTAFWRGPPADAIELRVFTPATGKDELVARISGASPVAANAFGPGQVAWRDKDRLAFATPVPPAETSAGQLQVFDRRTGKVLPAPTLARPTAPDESSSSASGRAWVGTTPASALGGAFGAWRSADGASEVRGALYRDRLGLASKPARRWDGFAGSLTACSFDAALVRAVCSHEDQTTPPRLVALSAQRSNPQVLADPNRRYAALRRLRVEKLAPREGRHGGYLVLPPDHGPSGPRPTVVVTHASDARDQFAFLGLQWGFPVQVFAAHGYAVALVNERSADASAVEAYRGQASSAPPSQVQQAMASRAVSILEATVADLVARGVSDPARVAVAGYSRGGIVSGLALSRSRTFRTGVIADTGLFSASGYWRSEDLRRVYTSLFGGSPADPAHQPAYQAFAPSWRAEHFAGPTLQLMTARVAPYSLELDTELRQAGVPTELIVYPDETHLPHRPRTLLAAMEVSFDWIEFWLRGRCRPVAADACARWRGQADAFDLAERAP